MRVLPYFQSNAPARPTPAVPAKVRTMPAMEGRPVPEAPAPAAASVKAAAGQDCFIPASPVAALACTIVRQEGSAGAVVKAGNYSLYRINGSLEQVEQSPRGRTLDLKG